MLSDLEADPMLQVDTESSPYTKKSTHFEADRHSSSRRGGGVFLYFEEREL